MGKFRFIFFLLTLSLLVSWGWFKSEPPYQKIAKKIVDGALRENHFLSKVKVKKEEFFLNYTIDDRLEKKVKKEIRRYRPDYVSVVVIENKTGKVLVALDYNKKKKSFGRSLPFTSTHPAASLFKIVSAVDFVKQDDFKLDQEFLFRGKRSTLYKWQLKDPAGKRWIRKTNLKKAFSLSNNVIFGQAAQKLSDTSSLMTTAKKMGIENDIVQLLPLHSPSLMNAANSYQLAEMASGFNKKTLISPIHAAVMSQIIANDGALKKPYLINEIRDNKEKLYQASTKSEQRIDQETASKVKAMMIHTVKRGTARRIFRRRPRVLRNMIIGGKTGTLTGGIPFGKRDWFTSFAYPKDKPGEGISVSVMMINLDKWFVRSSQLTKTIMYNYFKNKGK